MCERSLRTRGWFAAAKVLLSLVVAYALLSLAPGALEALAPAPLQVIGTAQADEAVYACGTQDAGGVDNVFTGYETFGIAINNYCGQAPGGLQINNDTKNTIPPGMSSGWIATAPTGLEIAGATVPSMYLSPTTVGTGYIADFYWAGGSQRVDNSSGSSYSVGGIYPSSTFGFDLECNPSGTTCPADGAGFVVYDIQLDVRETVNPSVVALSANNLWYKGASEYVRGSGWSIAYSASAPSGIESMSASQNGQPIQLPIPPGCTPNQTVWQQCPGTQTWSPTVSLSGNGDQPLVLSATSAAQNTSSPAETIEVDSQTPTIALSGPTTALSTAGTQYVTATAMVGPSGLGSIDCAVDGGPEQSYSTSPAEIPVSGLGSHSVQCTASNRSYDSAGQVAVSTPASFSIDIAQPTASGITFANVIHSLKCKKVKERVKFAARWVTIRRHGRLVKVHRRTHTKLVKAMKCRDRIVKRKVTELVKVKRHGRTVVVKRTKVEKVALPPHVVDQSTKRVAYGKGTTVSGILATTNGIALGGRTVQILTAANNQLGQWSQAAVVATTPEGTWTATLPPGPSRLVEASYAGDSTTLPSTSTAATLLVPARIGITIAPRQVRWSGVVTIRGHLAGGYVPPDGVPLYLEIPLPHRHRPYKPVPFRTNAKGTFAIEWSWGSGAGVATYPIRVALLGTGSNYPFTASSSSAVNVTFGRATPLRRRGHHKHGRGRKRKRRHAKHRTR